MRSTSTDFEDFFGISENSKVVKTTDVTATLPTNKGNANAGKYLMKKKKLNSEYIHTYSLTIASLKIINS